MTGTELNEEIAAKIKNSFSLNKIKFTKTMNVLKNKGIDIQNASQADLIRFGLNSKDIMKEVVR
jgi:hypothetical protein